ncbi:trypsin-like peptidase domain-containing protein [Desulfobulbus sp. TB]|nr:trypsin-like peptidase domain-containing protein [Desulfobulbus sp. TB]
MDEMNRETDWKFDEFFVWIHNHYKQIIGAGFLIGENEVATCAHVVRDVLGLQDTPTIAPTDDITLSFPFLKQNNISATVLTYGWDQEKDIALLHLNDDLPKGAQPVKLSFEKVENHHFSVYGFPKEMSKGVYADGVIKKKREHGVVQLESASLIGYAVQGGFSGGPVFDDELKQVVGMLVTSDESVRVASMIPVDMLTDICSRIGVNFELDEEKGDAAMNKSPREICENCLKESFTARNKEEFISLCMNHMPAVGRLLDEMRSIDWMINKVLDYSVTANEFERLWLMIKKSRPNQYQKFYQKWKSTVSTNQ